MRGIQGDLGALDLTDHMEWGIVLTDTERDGELTTSSVGMDCEGGVAGCYEFRTISSEPSWS